MEQKIPKKRKMTHKNTLVAQTYTTDGAQTSTVELPAGIFDVAASDKLLAQYIRVYLANQRQGTHKTKKRGEVKGSTRKIYRQKGTGKARHGARSAPIFVGGGVAHGVEPKSYTLKLNKKQRKKALYYSLTLKRKDDGLMVLKGAEELKGTTKEMQHTLTQCGIDTATKALFVYGESEKAAPFVRGLHNIGSIVTTSCQILNAYIVINAKKIVFTEAGLNEFITFRGFQQK